MHEKKAFATPEQIEVEYDVASVGSRFLAWFLDRLILGVITILVFFIGILLFVWLAAITEFPTFDSGNEEDFLEEAPLYVIGLLTLFQAFVSFVYFGLNEYFSDGQTPGKRALQIRVVQSQGFTLDAGPIILRNIFRAIDELPLFWIVPLLNEHNQRFGDLTAGTIVVQDRPKTLSPLANSLLMMKEENRKFRFSHKALDRLEPVDYDDIEHILVEWPHLLSDKRQGLLENVVPVLVRKLEVESPAPEDRQQWLTELLAAELRRRYRSLG